MARKTGQEGTLRIHQTVARELALKILSGELRPGANLGGEIERSEALGVSRTAYREGVRILIAKGMVESRPKAGTHVTPRDRWALLDPEVLAWTFTGTPDAAFVSDLFELRGVIEPAAAELAARRRSEEQAEALKAALADMTRWGLATTQGQAADQRFHRVVLEATGNAALVALASSVGAAVRWTTHFKQRTQGQPRDPIAEHAALCDAIVAQDEAGARAAMAHLLHLALADMKIG